MMKRDYEYLSGVQEQSMEEVSYELGSNKEEGSWHSPEDIPDSCLAKQEPYDFYYLPSKPAKKKGNSKKRKKNNKPSTVNYYTVIYNDFGLLMQNNACLLTRQKSYSKNGGEE